MKTMKKLIVLMLALMMVASCSCAFAEGDPWTCPECGYENTTKFCIKCGTKKPDEIVCPGCGMIYPFDTEVVFCGECGTKLREDAAGDVPVRYEGDGFDTPEEAALYYLAGLKNLDLEQMLSAFAWETQADRFDYSAMIRRAKGTDPTYIPGMPVFNDLSRSANLEQFRDAQANYICRALEYYVNDELFNSNTGSLIFKEDSELEEYLRHCDNGRIDKLKEMSNVRFYSPDDVTGGRFSLEKSYQSFMKQTAQYGADEVKAVFIAADVEGKTYAVSPTVVRYGDKWYMASVYSSVTGIIGIDSNRQSFYVVPDEVMESLNDDKPYSTVSDLPLGNQKIRYEGEGFSTPTEAVKCYFEGLKSGNVQQMLQAFTWETLADRYSLKDYVAWMQSVNFNSPVRMRFDNAFMTELNLGSLRYYQSRRIYSAIRSYILEDEEKGKDLLTGYRIDLREEEEIDAFVKCFDNGKAEKLKRLGNVRLVSPGSVIERYNSDSVNKRLATFQRIYGADEIMETLAVADLEGETLVFDPTLVRYGDKWYIASVEGAAFFTLSIDVNRQALLHIKGPAESLLLLLLQ